MRRVSRLLLLTTTLYCGVFYLHEVCAQNPGTAPSANKVPDTDSLRGPQKITVQGIEVEFTITPVPANNAKPSELMEEQDALLRFRVTDSATKTPWTGVRPAVWIARRQQEQADPKYCREKIQSYLQGTLRSRPDVDLNAYYLLALNQEPNISVIDPILGFGGSKLVTLILLPSPGEDWAITKDQSRLFVSMPAVSQIAIIDTNIWKVISKVDTRAKPVRLALQPDERYLWVGTEEGTDSGVTVIDTASLKVAAHIPTGAGPHDLVVDDNNKVAYVTNGVAGTLTTIDVQKLARIGDLKIGPSPAGVAFSSLSKSAYVSDSEAGQVVVIDARKRKVVSRVVVEPGVNRVRFAPGGRFGFAPNPKTGSVYIFDAASGRLLHTVAAEKNQIRSPLLKTSLTCGWRMQSRWC
jgi:YVTN family beta-propeller protein